MLKKILLVLAVVAIAAGPSLCLAGCEEKAEGKGEKQKLDGKKILMVIASSNFRDEEYAEPRKLLEAAGAKITVASSSLNESVGMLKKEKVKPDALISNVKAEDYDAVIFVGGAGAKEYFDSDDAHKLAKDANAKEKIVAAICIAPSILANAGILKDKEATAYSSEKKNLTEKGANFKNEDVVADGNIITASGPPASAEFGKKIIEKLSE